MDENEKQGDKHHPAICWYSLKTRELK